MNQNGIYFAFFLLIFFSCSNPPTENKKGRIDSLLTLPDIDKPPAAATSEIIKTKDSSETKGLRMTAEIKDDSVFFRYKNTGEKETHVWSHTIGYGLTWNAIDVNLPAGRIVTVEFDPMLREKSGKPVSVSLKPGKEFSISENISELIRFRISQKAIVEIPAGNYLIDVYYDSNKGPLDMVKGKDLQNEHWSGKLSVKGLSFTVKK
jgi:hypothetical protein